jgi:hypothetical protein
MFPSFIEYKQTDKQTKKEWGVFFFLVLSTGGNAVNRTKLKTKVIAQITGQRFQLKRN